MSQSQLHTSHSGDVRIEAPVVIREVIDDRTCHATLPNGKVIFAFLQVPGRTLVVGNTAKVILSLCDFSCGEIVE